MPEGRDYLAMVAKQPKDALQYGIKGMKWGIRRSPEQLAADSGNSGDGESSKKTSTTPSGPETSRERYSRLRAQAAKNGPSSLEDEDLKFINNRTEALSKVAKLNQQKPGWLSETGKKVLQNTAKNSMAQVAEALAQKHVSGPIVENITGAQKKAQEEAIKKGIEEGLKKAAKKS